MHRLERRGPGIDRVGPDIADHVGAQAEHMSRAVEPDLGIDDLIEGLAGRQQIFHAVAGPFDGAPKMTRCRADENLLRIERALAAETAADVGRDHAQAVSGQIERAGKRVADDARHLLTTSEPASDGVPE